MINRTFRSYRFLAPMLALGVAACSGAPGDASISAPAGPNSVRTTAVVGAAGNRIANQGELEICKNGAAGSFEVTPQGGSPFTVNLAAGECRVVATALNLAGPDTARFSVIELPSATATFTSVTKTTVHFEFAGGSNTTPDEFDAPFVSTTNVAVPVKVNEYIGSLLEYVNTPITTRGCTYTQGWYKNHTSQWPAGFSPTASFDGWGTWINLYNTPPKKGNEYIQLAHQYMTALMNASGASVPANVQTALNKAAAYFAAGGAGTGSGDIAGVAAILDAYNNGFTGPGHCGDEVVAQ